MDSQHINTRKWLIIAASVIMLLIGAVIALLAWIGVSVITAAHDRPEPTVAPSSLTPPPDNTGPVLPPGASGPIGDRVTEGDRVIIATLPQHDLDSLNLDGLKKPCHFADCAVSAVVISEGGKTYRHRIHPSWTSAIVVSGNRYHALFTGMKEMLVYSGGYLEEARLTTTNAIARPTSIDNTGNYISITTSPDRFQPSRTVPFHSTLETYGHASPRTLQTDYLGSMFICDGRYFYFGDLDFYSDQFTPQFSGELDTESHTLTMFNHEPMPLPPIIPKGRQCNGLGDGSQTLVVENHAQEIAFWTWSPTEGYRNSNRAYPVALDAIRLVDTSAHRTLLVDHTDRLAVFDQTTQTVLTQTTLDDLFGGQSPFASQPPIMVLDGPSLLIIGQSRNDEANWIGAEVNYETSVQQPTKALPFFTETYNTIRLKDWYVADGSSLRTWLASQPEATR
ncbi:hypothetical protein [Stomatohabitans albus]|uniref:hypothetical protein n=1 Tax=Stomatohabitans albus TaxID=3110766 RepID=UPI00300D7984